MNLKNKNMKTYKILTGILIMLLAIQIHAQDTSNLEIKNQTALTNATEIHTLAYIKDGVERPYKVTVEEQRTSEIKFNKADIGKVDQDVISTPENVTILITVSNALDTFDNRVISMKYKKEVNDTFELDSNSNGFKVNINGKVIVYTMGKGLSFTNPLDKNYFEIEEFDVIN